MKQNTKRTLLNFAEILLSAGNDLAASFNVSSTDINWKSWPLF